MLNGRHRGNDVWNIHYCQVSLPSVVFLPINFGYAWLKMFPEQFIYESVNLNLPSGYLTATSAKLQYDGILNMQSLKTKKKLGWGAANTLACEYRSTFTILISNIIITDSSHDAKAHRWRLIISKISAIHRNTY